MLIFTHHRQFRLSTLWKVLSDISTAEKRTCLYFNRYASVDNANKYLPSIQGFKKKI